MQTDSSGIATLRARIAGLRAPACDMAHERVPHGADGMPLRDATSASGYRRLTICPAAVRAGHLGCSHTAARLVLQRALDALGEQTGTLRGELQTLDGAIGLLDHRRYDIESRRADAVRASRADEVTAADRAIAALVREHRALGRQVVAVRDVILLRLDAAMSAPNERTEPAGTRPPERSIAPSPPSRRRIRTPSVEAQTP